MRGPSPKKSSRLNVPGVIVAAAFIEGDDERSVDEEIRPGSQVINRFFDHAFEEVEVWKMPGDRRSNHPA